jgi:P27 family predicted phage terminase small subunit
MSEERMYPPADESSIRYAGWSVTAAAFAGVMLHGTIRPTVLDRKMTVTSESPKRPTWLNKEAKRVWDHITEHLDKNDLLQSTDAYTLSAFCVSAARWQSAERAIDSEGQFIKEPIVNRSTGNVTGYKTVKHPAVIVARQERESMLKFAASFGLDLKSRTSLDIPPPVNTEEPEDAEEDDDCEYLYVPSGD